MAEGFKWHLKSCSLLLVSGVLLARARGSKIDPILVQNRGQKPPRSRPDGFESCLQYGCDFNANFDLFLKFLTSAGGPFWSTWGFTLGPSLLLVSGVSRDRARGSKIDPILVQNRGQMTSGGVQMGYKAES